MNKSVPIKTFRGIGNESGTDHDRDRYSLTAEKVFEKLKRQEQESETDTQTRDLEW